MKQLQITCSSASDAVGVHIEDIRGILA